MKRDCAFFGMLSAYDETAATGATRAAAIRAEDRILAISKSNDKSRPVVAPQLRNQSGDDSWIPP